jgi:Putative Ig domain
LSRRRGTSGVPLSFTVSATAPDAVTYAMSGAPAGMAMTGSGVVTWANPLPGTYAVVITARDGVTGLSGSGTYTMTIAAPAPPSVAPMTLTWTAGVTLSLQVQIGDLNPVTMTLSNAPAGMTSTGTTISWPSPAQGSFTVTVIAKDSKTGLTGQNTLKLTITAPQPPVVGGTTVTGRVGTALSFGVSVTNPNPVNYTLAGAPAGMSISAAGVVTWPAPVAGSYAVTVRASDPKTGLSGQGIYTVTIAVPGPVIKVTPIVGVAGKPVSGTIGISDASATSVSLTISGVPAGMAFALSGQVITATWAVPVTGNYTLSISAVDSAGLKASATVPVTITAH